MTITLDIDEQELKEMDNPICFYHWLHYQDYFVRWVDLSNLLDFYSDLEWYEHCKVIKEFKSKYETN